MTTRMRIPCSIQPSCGKTFAHTASEKRHRIQHSCTSDFKCERGCDERFVTNNAVLRHELRAHALKYSCTMPGCSKEYTSIESLCKHKKDKYPTCHCANCGAGYTSASWKDRHEATCPAVRNQEAVTAYTNSNSNTIPMHFPTSFEPSAPHETVWGNNNAMSYIAQWGGDAFNPIISVDRDQNLNFQETSFHAGFFSSSNADETPAPGQLGYISPYAGLKYTIPPLPPLFPPIPDSQRYHHPENGAWSCNVENAWQYHGSTSFAAEHSAGPSSFGAAYPTSGP